MTRRSLPVVPAAPYRRYPVRAADEAACADDERRVCARCIAGTCCSSEGPIALTSFDVLRLAAFLDLSPAEFLLRFTQDRFGAGDLEDHFAQWLDAPDSSVVTFVRRRANRAESPCVFLAYRTDDDGTPRRLCSVHDARPLACREYYYDSCGKRWTGELAVAIAHGFELVRDGALTADAIDAGLARLGPARPADRLATKWERAFWTEMRRALEPARANEEGSASYRVADYQDPIDAKLDRLLSRRNLRFEEKYGPVPHGEQLHAYTSGLSFRDGPERRRLLQIVETAPGPDPLFADGDYPHYVGLRTLTPGSRLANIAPPSLAIDRGDAIATAIVRGWSFLLDLAAHADRVQPLTELDPPGTFERALLDALRPFDRATQRAVTGTACLESARARASRVVARAPRTSSATRERGAPVPPRCPPAWRRRLQRIARHAQHAPRSAATETAALLAALERAKTTGVPAECLLDALASLASLGRSPPRALRSRVQQLALEWAARLERDAAWDDRALLRWPGLCGRLGIARAETPAFARGVEHVLAAQSPDGGWDVDRDTTELPPWQSHYLLDVLRTTSTALASLCAALASERASAT